MQIHIICVNPVFYAAEHTGEVCRISVTNIESHISQPKVLILEQ